jgi:nicotinate-nucleotide adenylyltransferase
MTAIGVLGIGSFVVTDRELVRSGPSFSVDTLRAFQAEGWQRWQLFFITGVDAFAEIDTWHEYPAVLDESHFAVVTRPGYTQQQLHERLPAFRSRCVDAGDSAALQAALAASDTRIFLVDAPTAAISSTEVRRRLAAGEPLRGLLPRRVERYIRQHQLYETVSTVSALHGQI